METLQYFDLVKNPEDIPFGFIIILEKIYWKKFKNSERKFLHSQTIKISKILSETYLYWVYKNKNQIPWTSQGIMWWPESAFFIFLAKEVNCSLDYLLNNYTYEQIREISNWIVWNANNITEEWKQINENWARRNKFVEKNDIVEIKENLARMREKRRR